MVPAGAVRHGELKLIEWCEKNLLGEQESAFEWYDLEVDKGETKNIADSRQAKAVELYEELESWRKAVNAQMPDPNKK